MQAACATRVEQKCQIRVKWSYSADHHSCFLFVVRISEAVPIHIIYRQQFHPEKNSGRMQSLLRDALGTYGNFESKKCLQTDRLRYF